jgi:hypothetical protein
MLKHFVFIQMLLILSMGSAVGQSGENTIRGAVSQEQNQRALSSHDDDGYYTDDYYYGKLPSIAKAFSLGPNRSLTMYCVCSPFKRRQG